MYSASLWNKTDPINRKTAAEMVKHCDIPPDQPVGLIIDEYGNVNTFQYFGGRTDADMLAWVEQMAADMNKLQAEANEAAGQTTNAD